MMLAHPEVNDRLGVGCVNWCVLCLASFVSSKDSLNTKGRGGEYIQNLAM